VNNKPPYQASVKLHTDGKWQWHFKLGGCHREVISYLDYKARQHYARFVYAEQETIAANTQDYRKPKDWCRECRTTGHSNVDKTHCAACGHPIYHRPYGIEAVKKVLAVLHDLQIVNPGDGMTQQGVQKTGYYIVNHDDATMPDAHEEYCVWWGDIDEAGNPVPFDHRTTKASGGLIAPPETFRWRNEKRGRKRKRGESS